MNTQLTPKFKNKDWMDSFFDDFRTFPTIGRSNPFLDMFTHTAESSYPPYNVIKITEGYLIEVAVPGWQREDLEVSFENRVLKVVGSKRVLRDENETEYVYKSLSTKAFTRSWVVSDDLSVESVFLEDGLLNVVLKKAEPEKPNLLTIE